MQKLLEIPIDNIIKRLTWRDVIILFILIIAILSRLTGLGDRVMSHDEVNHVVPAFDLFAGRGYRHDPITHGPLQFHLMGLSYFLFGDSDFTSRLPHAIFSIMTIGFVMIYMRRYLGNLGSIVAGILFTISPFMLFYGRYARNDVICVFLGIVSIYAILRFFESHSLKNLFLLTITLALNFTAKETAYIFSAQILVFVFLLFVINLSKIKIHDRNQTKRAIAANVLLIFIIVSAITASVLLFRNAFNQNQNVPFTFNENGALSNSLADFVQVLLPTLKFVLPGTLPLILLIAVIIAIKKHLRWEILSQSGSFSILILIGTLVLPLLAPFLVRFAGVDPSEYSNTLVVITDYIFIGALFLISYILGSEWDRENWWKFALSFYGIYIVFYTTFFTNPVGLTTGMVGSLGHWLNQQSVQRGGQPIYYYAFFLLPIYEFLSLFGALLAFYFGIAKRSFWRHSEQNNAETSADQELLLTTSSTEQESPAFSFPSQNLIPDPAFNIFLFITSIIAYTIAGEKMPWLTLHIVFPLILTASWAFDSVLEKFQYISKEKWFSLILILVLLTNTIIIVLQLLGNQPPFQSQSYRDLQLTYRFIFICLIEIALVFAVYKNKEKPSLQHIQNYSAISLIVLLTLITSRASYRTAFINFDYAKEFLVYAHAADGPKMILEQVEEISKRTTNGLDIKVAYDNHGLYPFWWYFRNYPNKIVYLENPTRSLEEAPVILAGQDKYAKLEPIVRDNFYFYEYTRLWWPMQDYWNLNWEKVSSALSDKNMRQALFNIWFNRDYSLYAETKNNQNLTLETWLPSEKMRLYIRKDIVAEMWQYVTDESFQLSVDSDPYAEKMRSKKPDGFISIEGSASGELNNPRGIDIDSDGLIYVADSGNNRIQVFTQSGSLENVWGTYANVLEGDAPGGTFNEPWDVAVAQDGSVFVADTFNHRIQKFDKNGRFIKMWGTFAQGEDPESFWGPRGIDIDQNGNVIVTDTGNKRVLVFDEDLNFITQFGGGGFEPGQFDEPVGITVDPNNNIIIADTWNRRVQIFKGDASGTNYSQINSFDIDGWFGQGIDNKPYITSSNDGKIYISDPEAGRILIFDEFGNFLEGYQDLHSTEDLIGYPFGLAVTNDGKLWFSDASTNILSYINIP